MDKINLFLERTNLSVKEEIIVSLIIFAICSIIFPLLKRKTEKSRKIRLATGDLTIGEYMKFSKIEEEKLTEIEKRALEKCKDKMNFQLNLSKTLENVNNIDL